MRQYLKCTLNRNEIEAVNSDHDGIDGVEVQLLDYQNDFSLLDMFQVPVYSIHMDLLTDPDNPYRSKHFGYQRFYGEPSVDLRENLFGYGPIPGYLDEVLDLCAKYDARLVLHAQEEIFTGTSNDEAVLVKLKELIKKHYGCTILLENSTCSTRNHDTCSCVEIPELCKRLNRIAGRTMFFPLLDLCHYYAEFSERTDHDFPSAAEIIEAYSHYGLKIHFSYSIGNGRGVNHGHDYSTNPELCRNILREIRKCDSSAALILEVREDDYIKRSNARAMHRMINGFLEKDAGDTEE